MSPSSPNPVVVDGRADARVWRPQPARCRVLFWLAGWSLAAVAAATQAQDQQPTGADPSASPASWGRWRLSARVQADHASFAGVYTRDGTRSDASYLRRAELELEWRWQPAWRAVLAVELDSQHRSELSDAFMGWQVSPAIELRAGRLDPDFGLEPSSSSSWILGIERSAIWDLAPEVASVNEGWALRADLALPGVHASVGVYDKRDHVAWVARAVWMPRLGSGRAVQLGLSAAQSVGWAGDGQLRSRLGVRGVSEHDAGRRSTLAAALRPPEAYTQDRVLGLEAAWQQGAWMFQAEWLARRLGGRPGTETRSAQGANVQLAWSLTAASRRHDPRRARFGRPQAVVSESGDWELFARMDRLSVQGGRDAQTRTVGLSWSSAQTWRAALNLHLAQSDDANRPGQTEGRGLSFRVQAQF